MRSTVFRIVVASTMVLQLLYGLAALLVPLAMLCGRFDRVSAREFFADAIQGGTATLLVAWCLRTSLRWLPTQAGHAIALSLAVGTMFVARGMLGLVLTPFAAFDVATGVALVVVSGAVWRARLRATT